MSDEGPYRQRPSQLRKRWWVRATLAVTQLWAEVPWRYVGKIFLGFVAAGGLVVGSGVGLNACEESCAARRAEAREVCENMCSRSDTEYLSSGTHECTCLTDEGPVCYKPKWGWRRCQ